MSKKYDVFLSYASVDNTDLAESYADQKKWVMCFKVALQQALDHHLGRSGEANWFLDAKDVRTGTHIGKTLNAALDNTHIFVALASNGYFHDHSWCKAERDHFIQGLGPHPELAERMYVVLLDEGMKEKWESECFEGVRAFPFYHKNSATDRCMRLGEGKISKEFIEHIFSLAEDIALKIKASSDNEGEGTPPAASTSYHGTVVLAAVPGEIEERRTELAEFITGEGWQVIPFRNECSSDVDQCSKKTSADCQTATAFIQLLSRFPWRPNECDRAQLKGALEADMKPPRSDGADKALFRFRGDEYPIQEVSSPTHQKWLQEHDVRARSMLAIKKEIGEHLKACVRAKDFQLQQQNTEPAYNLSGIITLSAAAHEQATVGKRLAQDLANQGIFPYLPDEPVPHLERCFNEEHGFMVIFGNEAYDRLETVLLNWRSLVLKRLPKLGHFPPLAIYISDPPPPNKADLINLFLPGMQIIRSEDHKGLSSFVESIKNYITQKQAYLATPGHA